MTSRFWVLQNYERGTFVTARDEDGFFVNEGNDLSKSLRFNSLTTAVFALTKRAAAIDNQHRALYCNYIPVLIEEQSAPTYRVIPVTVDVPGALP